jgi:hypothetical protein
MKSIKKPDFKVKDVLTASVSKSPTHPSSKNIIKASDDIEKNEIMYNVKKINNALYTLPQKKIVDGVIDIDGLKNIYSNRMLKEDNDARSYYDKLLSSAPRGKCPYCTLRPASTLDHYLPKSLYPLYSVTPINLIPACKDCNTGKLTEFPTCSEDETLHPYYDNVEDERWLFMRVINLHPIVFEYYVDAPENWGDLMKKRLEMHLYSFKLDDQFSTHAQEEFENRRVYMEKLFLNGGEVGLKKFLNESYFSCLASSKNSWQTAFYYGLYSCDEFINNYFTAF